MSEKSLKELDFSSLCDREFRRSPDAWEDQVLYFLMLDRFSDGREDGYRGNDGGEKRGTTPLFSPADAENAVRTEDDASRWREAGGTWVGGNLQGLTDKIGYLSRLGVTAVWLSPILKQVPSAGSYHGYGIQNYLEVDAHFGTREDLKRMVQTAHEHGIFVILDVILNHSGNVFAYNCDRHWTKNEETGEWYLDPRWDGKHYDVQGYRDENGNPDIPFRIVDEGSSASVWPNGAIWPVELQDPACFTGKGRISNWNHDPEYFEGDFWNLKDIRLGSGSTDHYQPSPALKALCTAYQFWIAYADLDGFRVDTVKHMDRGAARFFASSIHEFAQSIGKENFYLMGEITGGRKQAYEILGETGLDAALGINEIPDKLEFLVKGYRNPEEYFSLFRNSILIGKESHTWFKDKVVTLFDDHDQVRKGDDKARFCAGEEKWKKLALNVLALNATTLGIPCIYYGSEQCFDGSGYKQDRYIREAMFGGEFGAFRSSHRHFFDETGRVYTELSKILAIRRAKIALRRGRQYLREISGDGSHFGLPRMIGGEIRSVVPWSRIFNDKEMLLAINTDTENPRTAWVTVDAGLHAVNDLLKCIYSSDSAQIGLTTGVRSTEHGAAAVTITVPAAGFVIWE